MPRGYCGLSAAPVTTGPILLWWSIYSLFGEDTISSEEGVQQGNPLGPLFFCATIQPLLANSDCEFVAGYLDDIGLGDEVSHLASRVEWLEGEARTLGLSLNHSKCEVLGLEASHRPTWVASGLNFALTDGPGAVFLGSPLSAEGADTALRACGKTLTELAPRLSKLSAHEAFYLLKVCFCLPKLNYLLRTSLAFLSPQCMELDSIMRDLLSATLNVSLEGDLGVQASLPVRHGGLGVRSVVAVTPSAFLASSAAASALLERLLPTSCQSLPDPRLVEALSSWQLLGASPPPQGADASRQRSWDDPICKATFNRLFQLADWTSQARLLAVSAPDSGAWIQTLPCKNLGLHLTDREVRVAVGLRLGAPLVTPPA